MPAGEPPREARAEPVDRGRVDLGLRQRCFERRVAQQVHVALRQAHAASGEESLLLDLEHVRLRAIDQVARDLAVAIQA